jgi:isoleucyl-tRNA synthetase
VDGFSPEKIQEARGFCSDHFMDRWILARMTETERDVHRSMEAYEIAQVAPSLVSLIDDLTNWYIRMNRERFWNATETGGAEALAAHATLWQVLDRIAKLLAPFLPFLAESLYAGLRGKSVENLTQLSAQELGGWKSVHLQSLEVPASIADQDQKLLREMMLAKDVIVLGRSLRADAKLGVRQPLQRVRVAGLGVDDRQHLSAMSALILRELNIKELQVVDKAADLVEESIKPNHKVCGRKLGAKIKNFETLLKTWTSDDIARFESKGTLHFEGVDLTREDLSIVRKARDGRFASADKGRVVELDTTLTPELIEEGLRRELTNRIQQKRKEQKLNLADRIEVRWWAPQASLIEKLCEQETKSAGHISKETLAIRWARLSEAPLENESFGDMGSFAFELKVVSK